MNPRLTESQERKLSDTQRMLLQAVRHETTLLRREVVEVSEDIKAEIEKLRQDQKERHEQGVHDAELEHIRQEVKRKALGLLGTIGLTAEDLAAWKVKQDEKRR